MTGFVLADAAFVAAGVVDVADASGASAAADTSVLDAYGLGNFPFAFAVAALFVIVLCRAQGTYWLGRGVAAGVHTRPAVRRWAESDGVTRAVGLIHRWGPIAVTLSFLTVGLQTMVNAAAGLVRMPWLRYTLFMLPGCLAWALIYATIGLAAFLAIAAAAAGSPWGTAAIVALVMALVGVVWYARRRRAARVTEVASSVGSSV